MELRDALTQITEIRQQMARAEVFRGYRAMPAAFSGVVAAAAAMIQALAIPDPQQQLGAYLSLWIGAAVISGGSAVMEMLARARDAGSSLTRAQTAMAMEQFLPCLALGGMVTLVVVRSAPTTAWILPGLWQIFYSLGIFATSRVLPRGISAVAAFYALAGLTVLAVPSDWAFSPLAMGVPFGVGQMLAAAVLYFALERDHGAA